MNMHLSSLSDSKDSDIFQKVKYPLDKKLYSSSPKSNIESKAGKESLEILSLGAGVQRSTLLLMSLYGVLPKLDYVIFADTGWEPTAVYLHLEKLEKECEKYKVPIVGGNVSLYNVTDDVSIQATPILVMIGIK